jgi:ribonuclease PH
MNVVMTGAGRFVEVQGTAEGMAFSRSELDSLLGLAENGIKDLSARQAAALAEAPPAR